MCGYEGSVGDFQARVMNETGSIMQLVILESDDSFYYASLNFQNVVNDLNQ